MKRGNQDFYEEFRTLRNTGMELVLNRLVLHFGSTYTFLLRVDLNFRLGKRKLNLVSFDIFLANRSMIIVRRLFKDVRDSALSFSSGVRELGRQNDIRGINLNFLD